MNLIGTKVNHNVFGDGIVIAFDDLNERLIVQFDKKRIEFKYPFCFTDRFLKGTDESANAIIGTIIDDFNRIRQRREKEKQEAQSQIISHCEYDITRAVKTINFKKIVCDHIYGSNTREIYEEFCKTLNWDRSKAGEFGRQGAPLYAANVDTDRTSDVWFIPKPNCADISPYHGGNWLQDNCNTIEERVSKRLGNSNNANRITFLGTKKGYVFLGVYALQKNGLVRIFKKISDTYPITN